MFSSNKTGDQSPNDPKLSDCGAWHRLCRKVRGSIAQAVTRGAVRCSAWLGDVGLLVSLGRHLGQNSTYKAKHRLLAVFSRFVAELRNGITTLYGFRLKSAVFVPCLLGVITLSLAQEKDRSGHVIAQFGDALAVNSNQRVGLVSVGDSALPDRDPTSGNLSNVSVVTATGEPETENGGEGAAKNRQNEFEGVQARVVSDWSWHEFSDVLVLPLFLLGALGGMWFIKNHCDINGVPHFWKELRK